MFSAAADLQTNGPTFADDEDDYNDDDVTLIESHDLKKQQKKFFLPPSKFICFDTIFSGKICVFFVKNRRVVVCETFDVESIE